MRCAGSTCSGSSAGERLLQSIANLSGSPTFRTLAYRHTEHPEWNGFTFYDLIFPLFMFIAGVAVPFSFASHLARGESSARLHLRIIRRGILLVLLGLVINGILSFDFTLHFAQDASGHRHLVTDFSHVRFPSVLGRIGLGYLFAALIALHTRPRNQLLTAIGLLLGYWAALKFIPVPGFPNGEPVSRRNRRRLHRSPRAPRPPVQDRPRSGRALLDDPRDRDRPVRRDGRALAAPGRSQRHRQSRRAGPRRRREPRAGVICGAWRSRSTRIFGPARSCCGPPAGACCSFPSSTWSSTCGGSGAGPLFFVVIGANAITIYVGQHIIDFDALAKVALSDHMHRNHSARAADCF